MKKMTSLVFQILLFTGAVSVPLRAEPKAEPLRIEFKAGASSGKISGDIRGGEEMEYVAGARQGQTLEIKFSGAFAGAVAPTVKDPGFKPVALAADGKGTWSGVLPADGDYWISVAKTKRDGKPAHYEGSVAIGSAKGGAAQVGTIQDTSPFLSECGYFLQMPAEAKAQSNLFIFASTDQKEAVMNINGKDVWLTLASGEQVEKDIMRGARPFGWVYRSGDIEVSIDMKPTSHCAPNDGGCEGADYDAVMSVGRGADKKTLNLKGRCGC